MSFLNKFLFNFNKVEVYLIESDSDKEFVLDSLENENIIGIDTEFDWRNTYFPNLSLIQISTSNKIILIDCQRCKNLDYLKEILEKENRLCIFHSVRSDTTVLFTSLNIKISNVFDIQIADKLISNNEIKSYASIVEFYCSLRLSKTETNSNWLKRPFSDEQLEYAANDVKYLIQIYKKQLKVLKKLKVVKKAFEISKKEADLGNKELYISRLNKMKKNSKKEKNLFLWREKVASKLNVPPSYIYKDKQKKILFNSIMIKNEGKIFDILKNKELTKDLLKEFD
tara:strand:+ start:16016 stop:16864 length:849 start_codon:yes stop_codon:yes gene_type:complete